MTQPLQPLGLPRLRIVLYSAIGAVSLGCSAFQTQNATTPTTTTTPELIERAQASTQAATPPVKPGKYSFRISQFVFYSDVPLDPNDPLFQDLEELPDQLQRELKLPPSTTPVQVFLFEDQERYEAYIKARDPKLPQRPAFFFAEQRSSGMADELFVFTWLGKRLRTDLRHELTHALLHGVLKSVPLWLDEGLAGFFEQPLASDGVNVGHLNAVRAASFRPNLARLEKLEKVDQMQRPEYQEAWAWVHFMLRGNPKSRAALLDYLQALRTSPNAGSLQSRLEPHFPDTATALLEHLPNVDPAARIRSPR